MTAYDKAPDITHLREVGNIKMQASDTSGLYNVDRVNNSFARSPGGRRVAYNHLASISASVIGNDDFSVYFAVHLVLV